MIPKIIHYCWFGGGEMPQNFQEYIAEWRALHPDWEIKRWDETNSPVGLPYLHKALAQKKWANMSNFVRFHALLNEGGIYLDTDMKLVKPMDHLLVNKCFLGFEEGSENGDVLWVNNAIIGAEKNNTFIGNCYETLLANFDGSEEANLSAPRLVTNLLIDKYNLKTYGFQELEGVTLYPRNFFYPIHYDEVYKLDNIWDYIDESTVAVHMWSRSWLTATQLLKMFDDLRFNYEKQVKKSQNYESAWEIIRKVFDDYNISQTVSEVDNIKQSSFSDLFDLIRSLKQELDETKSISTLFSANLERLLNREDDLQLKEKAFEVERVLNEKNEIIISLQNQLRANENRQITELNVMYNENALLKQAIANKEIETVELEAKSRSQAEMLQEMVSVLQSQLQLLSEQKQTIQAALMEKETLLQKVEDELTESIKDKERYSNEINDISASLNLKGQQLVDLKSDIKTLQEERSRLLDIAKEKDEAVRKEKAVRDEVEKKLLSLESEYSAFRQIQEKNNAELISLFQNKVNNYVNEIKWYQATYENRKLFGIIKDKMIKSLNILKK